MENELCIFCGKEPITYEGYKMGDSCFLKLKQVRKRTPGPVRFSKSRRVKPASNELPKFYKKDLKARMIDKRGQEFVDDIISIESKPFSSHSELGRKYGISRERIRQIYVAITGRQWRTIKVSRDAEARKDIGCRLDPRNRLAIMSDKPSLRRIGTETEVLFLDECRRRGFTISCPPNQDCDTIVNGYNIEVKHGGKMVHPGPRSKTGYAHAQVGENSFKVSDFVAFYHKPRGSWFIIPIRVIPSSGGIFISEKPSVYFNAKNKYERYREAWDLLESVRVAA